MSSNFSVNRHCTQVMSFCVCRPSVICSVCYFQEEKLFSVYISMTFTVNSVQMGKEEGKSQFLQYSQQHLRVYYVKPLAFPV